MKRTTRVECSAKTLPLLTHRKRDARSTQRSLRLWCHRTTRTRLCDECLQRRNGASDERFQEADDATSHHGFFLPELGRRHVPTSASSRRVSEVATPPGRWRTACEVSVEPPFYSSQVKHHSSFAHSSQSTRHLPRNSNSKQWPAVKTRQFLPADAKIQNNPR